MADAIPRIQKPTWKRTTNEQTQTSNPGVLLGSNRKNTELQNTCLSILKSFKTNKQKLDYFNTTVKNEHGKIEEEKSKLAFVLKAQLLVGPHVNLPIAEDIALMRNEQQLRFQQEKKKQEKLKNMIDDFDKGLSAAGNAISTAAQKTNETIEKNTYVETKKPKIINFNKNPFS